VLVSFDESLPIRYGQEPNELEDNETRTYQEQPDTGPAPQRGPVPGGMRPRGRNLVELPPHLFPPQGSHPIDKPGVVTLTGLAGPSVAVRVLVPLDTNFRVDGIGWGADTEVALDLLTWSLFSQDQVTEAYFDIPAAVGSFRHTSTVFVVIKGPAVVELRGTNSDTVASVFTYFGRLKGWLYQDISTP
jgi:hypothetical protein